jgi:hypothetical protein
MASCADCKNAAAEYRELVHSHLPLIQGRLRQRIDMIFTRPDSGARERFIRRASLEGITFSPDVKRMASSRRPTLRFAAAGAGVLAAIVTAVLYISHLGLPSGQLDVRDPTQARQQIDHLTQQNSTLETTISRLEQTSAEQQREAEGLRTQVATLGGWIEGPAGRLRHIGNPDGLTGYDIRLGLIGASHGGETASDYIDGRGGAQAQEPVDGPAF